jgi:hypothetical protein
VQPQLRPDLSRAQFKTSLPCAFCELLRVPAMFGGLVSPDLSGQSAHRASQDETRGSEDHLPWPPEVRGSAERTQSAMSEAP